MIQVGETPALSHMHSWCSHTACELLTSQVDRQSMTLGYFQDGKLASEGNIKWASYVLTIGPEKLDSLFLISARLLLQPTASTFIIAFSLRSYPICLYVEAISHPLYVSVRYIENSSLGLQP